MVQSIAESRDEKFLRPMLRTSKLFFIVVPGLLILICWVFFAWYQQLTHGLSVTGLRTPVGAIWGLYITNFVFFVAISSAGIAIASCIRLFKLKDYIVVARIAELATVFSLMAAGVSIIMSIGRPDRLFNLITYFPSRVSSSPLTWDVMGIYLYMIFSITYLYVEMREDLAWLAGKVKWGWVYKLLVPAYRPDERQGFKKIVLWASVFNFPIMVMVDNTVGCIFGLLVGRPGWYSQFLGPYFVLGAIFTGLAVVVVLAAIYRQTFHWQEFIKPVVFRGLGRMLCWVSITYIYFLISEFMAVNYSGPTGEVNVWESLTRGAFAPVFWTQIIMLVIAFLIFFINTIFPKFFRIWTTVLAAGMVIVALWSVRFLIVVPSLLRPFLPFPTGTYSPSWVELSMAGGAFAIFALLFILFTKFLPIMPVTEMLSKEEER